MFCSNQIPIPSIIVAKLVIEKPSRNPIWTISRGRGEAPVVTRMFVSRMGDKLYSFVFGFLEYVTPIVGRLPLAVLLQVPLLRR